MDVLKEVFIEIVKYGFPTVAILLSILSYNDSRKANKVKNRLNKLEEKLQKYELEDKEREREEATKAYVEARLVKVSKNNYRLKIFNLGKVSAFNVDYKIESELEGMIRRDKVPYEFLDPGKSFEEIVFVHMASPRKFNVVTSWKDSEGKTQTKTNLVSV